jgi:sugar-specific transcriptional regulator TrmB
MTINTIQKDLQTLGFTKNVSKVYLALVELGETKAGAIVKKTGMHRHLVYTALDELEEKKLVSRIQKGGVARFVPLSPEALLISVQQTQELATSIITNIQKLQTHTNTQKVIIYESLQDMAAAEMKLYDLMQPEETQYILGLSSKWFDLLGKERVQQLAHVQNEKKFYIKGIGSYLTEHEQLYVAETNELTHFKMIPGVGSNDTEVNILQDRILIKVFVEPYTCVEIINSKLAQDYRKYFETLWNQEVQTYVGWDAVENLLSNDLMTTMGPEDIEYAQGTGYDIADDKERFAAFWLSYNKKRITHGIKRRLMMYEPYRELVENEMSLAGDESRTITEMRYLPKEYNSPMETHIYNNKVVLIVWQGTPVATVYNRPEMAISMRNQFEMLWGVATE